jgi:hypothetical protein
MAVKSVKVLVFALMEMLKGNVVTVADHDSAYMESVRLHVLNVAVLLSVSTASRSIVASPVVAQEYVATAHTDLHAALVTAHRYAHIVKFAISAETVEVQHIACMESRKNTVVNAMGVVYVSMAR